MVEVTDENGCKTLDTTEVVVNALPQVSAGVNGLPCEEENVQLTESGGEAESWAWSGPQAFQSTVASVDITDVDPGLYFVTGTDSNGCQSVDSVEIYTLPRVVARNGGPYCPGQIGYVTETGGDAVSWVWQFPSGFSSGKKSPIMSTVINGNFVVTATDANGCKATDVTTVCVSVPQMACKDDVTIELDENGTTTITTDVLDAGSAGSACAGLSALSISMGTFNCTDAGIQEVDLIGTDSLGCQGSCTAEVTVVDPSSDPGENCACDGDDLVLGGNLPSDDYKATLQIESDGVIASGDRVIFQAGERIILSPGFSAETGSELVARIDTCVVPWSSGLLSQSALEGDTHPPALDESSHSLWTAIDNYGKNGAFRSRVYPNPFRVSFVLDIFIDQTTLVEVEMLTIQGRIVRSIRPEAALEVGEHNLEIKGEHLPPGLYLLQVRTEGGEQLHRIVKVK